MSGIERVGLILDGRVVLPRKRCETDRLCRASDTGALDSVIVRKTVARDVIEMIARAGLETNAVVAIGLRRLFVVSNSGARR